MQYPKSDYIEYPKTLAADDFWGQVRRTLHGKPVPEEQIALIVEAIRSGLALSPQDVCLDIACGNGALSDYLIPACAHWHGVDLSPYLIEVANKHFRHQGRASFALSDAASYVRAEPRPEQFTKVLCYGSFSYFSPADALTTLTELNRRFTRVSRVYIGNLPDRAQAARFYPPGKDYHQELDEHASQIGLWRSTAQFRALAQQCGWKFEARRMPSDFYAAHYRYDALLTR